MSTSIGVGGSIPNQNNNSLLVNGGIIAAGGAGGALAGQLLKVNADDVFTYTAKGAKKNLKTLLKYKDTILKQGFDKLDDAAKETLKNIGITNIQDWKSGISITHAAANRGKMLSGYQKGLESIETKLKNLPADATEATKAALNKAKTALETKKNALETGIKEGKELIEEGLKNPDDVSKEIIKKIKNGKMLKYAGIAAGVVLGALLIKNMFFNNNKKAA